MLIALADITNRFFYSLITKNIDPDNECSFAVKFVCCITEFCLKVTNLGQCRDHSILGLFFNLITILSKQINRGFIYSSIYHNLNRYNVMCNFPFIGHSKYEIFLT